MSFSKPQFSFSSNLYHSSVSWKITSPVLFWIKRYTLCTKGTNQSGNFENSECSGQNSPNSCHVWNIKSVFLQIWHHSLVSWGITPVYFFSWNLIYFQQKEPIKVQIWQNFTWAVESLKFCTLMGFFCPSLIKFQLKKYRRVMTLKTDLCFQIWHEEFGDFSHNHSKVWKMFFNGLLMSKVHKVWATKIQISYLSKHWTVMQNLNKPWPCGFNIGMRNWVKFH